MKPQPTYHPFGLKHSLYTSGGKKDYQFNESDPEELARPGFVYAIPYQYKYNGKELQDELNLNLYDYGWRNYDPALGRWHNLDPHSETYYEWSPYHYSANNPVFFVDIDGRDWFVNNENGNVIYLKGVNDLSKMSEEKIKKHNLGDISKYENFGADDMFGDSINWGDLGDLLQYDSVSMNGESEMFMYFQGYYQAEKVDIVESKRTEFSTDRSKHTSIEYLQDGDVKKSYASLSAFGSRKKTKDPTIDYYPFSNVMKQYHEYTVKPGEGQTLKDRLNDDKSSFSSPRIKGGTAGYKELLKEVIKLFKK